MIRNITRSLSARLLGIFVLTSLVYVAASRFAAELVYDTDYLRQIVGAHIALHADYVLNDIGNPPSIERAQAIANRVPVDFRIIGPGVDWASDPRFPPLQAIPFGPLEFLDLDETSKRTLEDWARSLERVEVARYDDHVWVRLLDGEYQVSFVSPRIAEMPSPDYTIPIISIISIIVLAGCYFLVRVLIRPIEWIQEGAARIGEGDLDFRIRTTRHDDLGELALGINRMAADVQEMLEAKRQLLLAISHELRTPLTRAKVACEFLDDEEAKRGMLEELGEMERLIGDLLESERLNTRHSKLQRSATDLTALVEGVIGEDLEGSRPPVELHLPADELVRDVDAARIRLLVKNLAENAVRYSQPDSAPVEMRLEAVPGAVRLRVRDHGQGIPPEHLPRVTEPFYRADPARCRTTGGFGLGLYLCRRVAEAHGGTLVVESTPGRGTTVTVTLPDVATTEPADARAPEPATA